MMPTAPRPLSPVYISAALKRSLRKLADEQNTPLNRLTENLINAALKGESAANPGPQA